MLLGEGCSSIQQDEDDKRRCCCPQLRMRSEIVTEGLNEVQETYLHDECQLQSRFCKGLVLRWIPLLLHIQLNLTPSFSIIGRSFIVQHQSHLYVTCFKHGFKFSFDSSYPLFISHGGGGDDDMATTCALAPPTLRMDLKGER
eukprot:754191-Hanusia_phi.AAC.7